MNYKILIVDDEPANLRMLERLFRREYQVVTANSGSDALELLRLHDFALIISDQRMPGMTGIEFLKHAAEMRQHTVRIILTGYTDINALVEVINSGVVYKYVTKPWVNEDLQQTVVRAIEHYDTIKRRYELTIQNERLVEQVDQMKRLCVRLIGDTLDLKDPSMHRHSQRASGYAAAIGHRLNLDVSEIEELSLAAFLHDVGKIGASADSLHQTSPHAEENQMCRRCAERGVQMLASIPGMNEIAATVRHQFERYDGTGIPGNLAAEHIPISSRIVAVVDAYDALTAPRNTGETATHEQAIEKLRGGVGKQFDRNVVEAFCEIDSIAQIRRRIADDINGSPRANASVSGNVKNLSTGEILQKFKTEPLLALEVLRTGNSTGDDEPTARLLPLMSKIGEPQLRFLYGRHGLPTVADDISKERVARSLRRAVAAQMLAAHTGVMHPDDAYTLGLLFDVGEILLSDLFPAEMRELEKADAKARPQRQAEIFGIDAAQISREMLEAAGVPNDLAAAIENHQDFMHTNQPSAHLIRIACRIADTEPACKTAEMTAIENNVLEALNLSRTDLSKIYDRANFISE